MLGIVTRTILVSVIMLHVVMLSVVAPHALLGAPKFAPVRVSGTIQCLSFLTISLKFSVPAQRD